MGRPSSPRDTAQQPPRNPLLALEDVSFHVTYPGTAMRRPDSGTQPGATVLLRILRRMGDALVSDRDANALEFTNAVDTRLRVAGQPDALRSLDEAHEILRRHYPFTRYSTLHGPGKASAYQFRADIEAQAQWREKQLQHDCEVLRKDMAELAYLGFRVVPPCGRNRATFDARTHSAAVEAWTALAIRDHEVIPEHAERLQQTLLRRIEDSREVAAAAERTLKVMQGEPEQWASLVLMQTSDMARKEGETDPTGGANDCAELRRRATSIARVLQYLGEVETMPETLIKHSYDHLIEEEGYVLLERFGGAPGWEDISSVEHGKLSMHEPNGKGGVLTTTLQLDIGERRRRWQRACVGEAETAADNERTDTMFRTLLEAVAVHSAATRLRLEEEHAAHATATDAPA